MKEKERERRAKKITSFMGWPEEDKKPSNSSS